MQNYKKVHQWASTVDATKAKAEIEILKLKYPWLKCDESIKFIQKMSEDLPKIINIIKHQEKQNAGMKKYIEVNQIADAAIVEAIKSQYGL